MKSTTDNPGQLVLIGFVWVPQALRPQRRAYVYSITDLLVSKGIWLIIGELRTCLEVIPPYFVVLDSCPRTADRQGCSFYARRLLVCDFNPTVIRSYARLHLGPRCICQRKGIQLHIMPSLSLLLKPLHHPRKALLAVFTVWKCLLLLIAAGSPGFGYDTSTTLAQPYGLTAGHSHAFKLLHNLAIKLTRWDAIYYTKIATRGYLYEQEWAFGWGFTRLIHFFAEGMTMP